MRTHYPEIDLSRQIKFVACPVCGEKPHSACSSPRSVLQGGYHPARIQASMSDLRARTRNADLQESESNDEKEQKNMTKKNINRVATLLKLKSEVAETTNQYEEAVRTEILLKLEYLAVVGVSVAWKLNAIRNYETPNEQIPLGEDLWWIRDRLEVTEVTATGFTVLCHPRYRRVDPVEKTFRWDFLSLSDRDMAKQVRASVRKEKVRILSESVKEGQRKVEEAQKAVEAANDSQASTQRALARAEAWLAAKHGAGAQEEATAEAKA